MNARLLLAAAVFGGLAVALGAFGAHALRPVLPLQKVTLFETAVRYQMWHALALLGLALAPLRGALPRWAGRGFIAGIVLFCGSLYGMATTDQYWLGVITPLGGLSWLAGWTLLAIAAYRAVKAGH